MATESSIELSIHEEQYSTAPKWNQEMISLISIGFAILMVVLTVVFWSVIPLALTTVVIAYLLNPITESFSKHVTFGRRSWAVLLTFMLIILVVFLIFSVLVPPLAEQTINGVTSLFETIIMLIDEPIIFNEDTPFLHHPETQAPIAITSYLSLSLQSQGFDTVNDWVVSVTQNLSLDREALQQLFNFGGGVTSGILGSVFIIAGSTITMIFNALFFVSILSILLAGGNNITQKIISVVPDGYERDSKKLLTDLGNVWNSYVRGNFTLGVIMGFAMWLFATILGLPNPLFLAFVAFAMEFIPNIGPLITMVIAAILSLASGSATFPEMNGVMVAGIVVVVWMIMQQLEAMVLVPRIVGNSLKLNPAIVVLAVIWGGSFGGIVGIIIAPPLVSSIRIVVHYIYGRLTGRTAFSAQAKPRESRIRKVYKWLQLEMKKQLAKIL